MDWAIGAIEATRITTAWSRSGTGGVVDMIIILYTRNPSIRSSNAFHLSSINSLPLHSLPRDRLSPSIP